MRRRSMHLVTAARRGISLLEVLITMFVLAVGILSIFALFTAGRELESRAAIKSQAIAFAATLKTTIGSTWLDRSQWLYPTGVNPPTYAPLATPGSYCLPIAIDPWALSSGPDVQITAAGTTAWPDDQEGTPWDWRRMAPLGSGTTVFPFRRVTLPALTSGVEPFTREGFIATLSDQDAIEYKLTADQNSPPLNAFEYGRRKRGSDLVPVLFLGTTGTTAASFALQASTPVSRTLLIFHKPVPDFEEAKNFPIAWPAGFLELRVDTYATGLIEARVPLEPADQTVIRRSLRPGNWLLLTKRVGTSPKYYATQWTKMTSVTKDDASGTWLIVVEKDIVGGTTAPPGTITCYAFEHLIHVEDVGQTSLP